MTIGFFTVFRRDPQHYLHAMALVREAHAVMPDVTVMQLTDQKSPEVPGVNAVARHDHGPMLQRRLEHYASCWDGDWLLVDTDVSIRQDVRSVFDDTAFDVALTDRQWPHLPQPADVLHTMPFNTGVCFSRSSAFWARVLEVWRQLEATDWLSEQKAVAVVVKSGQFRVKWLPGMVYNYPPQSITDQPASAAILHYKGPRKAWRTQQMYQDAARCA